LAGFRSLDEREDRYKEAREVVKTAKVKKPVLPSKSFFNDILNKTKSLLIDDLDGKNEY
jgi:cell division protein FtsA